MAANMKQKVFRLIFSDNLRLWLHFDKLHRNLGIRSRHASLKCITEFACIAKNVDGEDQFPKSRWRAKF